MKRLKKKVIKWILFLIKFDNEIIIRILIQFYKYMKLIFDDFN